MFDLNPLNLPDALLQHSIMLFVAGVLGFIIGYIGRQQTVYRLQRDLTAVENEVENQRWRPARVAVGAGNDEAIVLSRIAGRADRLNAGRIGHASPSEADDLKKIASLGPLLEKKLNAVGIYTYRQLARLNHEDVYLLNEIIEYFPGRIERDNWVGQAAELEKLK